MTKFILIWIVASNPGLRDVTGFSGSSTFDDPLACVRAANGIETQARAVAPYAKLSWGCYPTSSSTDIVKEMEKLRQ